MPGILRRLIIGNPLPTVRQAHERLTNVSALAVFASDGVSSVAYATEEILLMLALAGTAHLHLSMPLAIGIALLIGIVATSFRQVVHAYPHGGGSYAVARENLGVIPGQIAGAALFVDYVLTVAVSVASGVAAITSAFPSLFDLRVPLGVLAILIVTIANLRGVRESARAFMLPTYAFIISLYALIVVGLVRYLLSAPPVEALPTATDVTPIQEGMTVFLLLRAFSSGCAALTGLEAVSDGVTAFREPVSRNAARVMTVMAVILGTLFVGITFLANRLNIMPVHHETVVSQIARATFGRDWFYYAIQAFTAIILILAANTSFNGFPRLASVQAADGFLPRQLANLGDRLVYANGIIALGLVATLVLIAFQGETHRLIPLYAVGVFLTFTLAQAGLVRHWMAVRNEDPGWRPRMLINGLGATVTGIVAVVIAVTKFMTGAWIVVIIIPILVVIFLRINRHYSDVSRQLNLSGATVPPPVRNLVLVLVGSVHRGMLEAVRYAQSLPGPNGAVRAIHIETESDRPRPSLMAGWDQFGLEIPLVVVQSPYRDLVGPLLGYMDKTLAEGEFDCITLVLPEVVVSHWWEQLLHNQTALWLQFVLRSKPDVVVVNYRYFLSETGVTVGHGTSGAPEEAAEPTHQGHEGPPTE